MFILLTIHPVCLTVSPSLKHNPLRQTAICLFGCLFIHFFVCLAVCLFVCLAECLFVCLFAWMFICFFFGWMYVCLFIYLFVCLFVLRPAREYFTCIDTLSLAVKCGLWAEGTFIVTLGLVAFIKIHRKIIPSSHMGASECKLHTNSFFKLRFGHTLQNAAPDDGRQVS